MITPEQYREMLARTEKNRLRESPPAAPVQRESDLHDKIMGLCKTRGYYFVHSRMDRKTTNAVGTPDFIIAMPSGKTLWLECKRKGNKPTMAQLATIVFLQTMGHQAAIVSSIEEVIALTMPPRPA